LLGYYVAQSLGYYASVDCVSAMSYNEYWTLLRRGVPLAETTVFRFSELGIAFLEDGIYVDERRLADPDFKDRLTRFLRASLRGWEYALKRPDQAVALLMQLHPDLDEAHQRRMAEEVARLVDSDDFALGMMRIDAYDRTVDLLRRNLSEGPYLRSPPGRAWTDEIWSELAPDENSPFSTEVRYRLQQILSAKAFYILDLIGTLAFGIAGFARAQERRYDIWGALVLTSLPAVGGGTLRDLLVGASAIRRSSSPTRTTSTSSSQSWWLVSWRIGCCRGSRGHRASVFLACC